MDEDEWLADRFEEHRAHLRAWPTGCWARSPRPRTPSRTPGCGSAGRAPSEVDNLGGWLTTVVARVCLNMLRSRDTSARGVPRRARARPRHQPRTGAPTGGGGVAGRLGRPRPARRARHADPGREAGVRPARHVRAALRRDRSHGRPKPRGGQAARQQGTPPRQGRRLPAPDPDPARQREVVDAFFAAARGGDFDALVAVLDPDVVLRTDARRQAARPPPG